MYEKEEEKDINKYKSLLHLQLSTISVSRIYIHKIINKLYIYYNLYEYYIILDNF